MSTLPPRRTNSKGNSAPVARPQKRSSNTKTILLIVGGVFLALFLGVAGVVAFVVVPTIREMREAERMSVAKNNLKQMGLAAHEFHDIYWHFPPLAPAEWDDSERPPMSWHATILPSIEQGNVYLGIEQKKAWDDPVNRRMFQWEVSTFLHPRNEMKTDAAGYAVTHFVHNTGLVRRERGMKIGQITDGSSSTMMAGEINAAFPAWGDPSNGRDGANGFAGGPTAFGSTGKQVAVLMADGSVRLVDPNLDAQVARRIATPDDGELTGEF